jgi:hypothetical protein
VNQTMATTMAQWRRMHSKRRDWIGWIGLACACSALGCDRKSNDARSDAATSDEERFSFFVASFQAMQALSGNEAGFGGDLRYGETGPGAGLRGADKICSEIAERSMPGSSSKRWRAFLSAAAGEDGEQVDAIDRIGDGPWYDRLGRVFALTKADLLTDRPTGIDEAIAHDFPNEDGVPNQKPDPNQPSVDNHDILTGTNAEGQLYSSTATCLDWTSAIGDPTTEGRPRVGHSWDRMASDAVVKPPDGAIAGDGGMFHIRDERGDGGMVFTEGPDGAVPPDGPKGDPMRGDGARVITGPMMIGMGGSGQNWMSTLDEAGCAAGVNLVQDGPPKEDTPTVGSGGGYGGIYCFALRP